MNPIKVKVLNANAMNIEGDVLALKYAQHLYGLDKAVITSLTEKGGDTSSNLPDVGETLLLESRGAVKSHFVLFVGVRILPQFQYREIREFARRVLVTLHHEKSDTRTLLLTIHGPGYGLDEQESFESELAGITDAIASNQFPEALESILFIERDPGSAKRLDLALGRLLPNRLIPTPGSSDVTPLSNHTAEKFRAAGYDSASKPSIFVAMPFSEDFNDVFHYGIQGAANFAGFLCERADTSAFTGDIMLRAWERIANCNFLVADLSGANPNVYLEVGFAWGLKRPTILIVKDKNDLKFDVQGHRCIVYKSIKDLEEALSKELKALEKGLNLN